MEGGRIAELLSCTRDLEGKSRSNEFSAQGLLKMGEQLQLTIDNMKVFRETLTQVSGQGHDRNLPQIEQAYLQQLQRDNAELKGTLQDHQIALEMIMTSYRQQVCSLIEDKKSDQDSTVKEYEEELYRVQHDVYHMTQLMAQVASADDTEMSALQEKIAQLSYENKSLKELLDLSNQRIMQAYETDQTLQDKEETRSTDSHQHTDEPHTPISYFSPSSRKSPIEDVFNFHDSHPSLQSTEPPKERRRMRSPKKKDVNMDIAWPESFKQDNHAVGMEEGLPDKGVDYALQQIDDIFEPWMSEKASDPGKTGNHKFDPIGQDYCADENDDATSEGTLEGSDEIPQDNSVNYSSLDVRIDNPQRVTLKDS